MSDSNMNDAQEQQVSLQDRPEDVAQSAPSPGAHLAARREELGLTLERVAEQLKMTTRKVMAIEADNYDAVHGKAIYKGFVRAYAKVLKMDSDALVAMVPDDSPAQKKLTPVRRNASEVFTETRMPVIGQRGGQSKAMIGAIAVLFLLIAVLVAQKMGWMPSIPTSIFARSEKAPISATAEASKQTVASSATAVAEGGKIKQIELPLVDVSSQLASASVSAAAAPASTDNATVPGAAASVDTGNALVLKFREESWVELKRANGGVLASRKIAAGASETFEITEPVQLTLGNGPGVEATLRGASLEIPVDSQSKVVRLNLK